MIRNIELDGKEQAAIIIPVNDLDDVILYQKAMIYMMDKDTDCIDRSHEINYNTILRGFMFDSHNVQFKNKSQYITVCACDGNEGGEL